MNYQTSGANLYYETCGNGRPLILLHGNGESHAIFEKAIPRLAKRYTVYAVDSRGHGNSSPVNELHYEEMAQDVAELIRGLRLEKPIVYGFSDGGIIALLLGIREPDLLSGIVASGVNANPKGIQFVWLTLFRLFYFFNRSQLYRLMLTEPDITKEMLETIPVPVSVIGGSKDMIRERHMRWIADCIPNGRFTRLEGETHSSYVVNNEKLAELIIGCVETMEI
ncbi:MAG: alpha/beta hydrolase [Lachnospiraceae bacterium]|nr:alpha/beta hydrolase [Lachnospiraceae bacterium]